MNWGVIVAIAVLVAAVAAWAAAMWAQRRTDRETSALRQEIQNLLATQAQGLTAQLGQLTQAVTQQLGQVSQQVQSGMASTGTLVSDAQRAVSVQLQSATTIMGSLQQQLGKVEQSGRDLSDAAVHVNGKLVPIDSKFPLDDFRRMGEEGEEARKGFSTAVRNHADAIAKKYIVPGENTLDFALMFVPSEGVYYELLMSSDSKGVPLDAYCRQKNVIPVSPNSLYARLSVILMGLKGLQIEENARRLHSSLSGLKTQWDNFAGVYEKLGTHLRNAQQSYSDADRKLDRARDALDQMAQGTLPEASPKALEAPKE